MKHLTQRPDRKQLEAQLTQIIQQHLAQQTSQIEPVWQRHFAKFKPVFSRHWRHKSDIPKDLIAAPKQLWLLISKLLHRLTPFKKTKAKPADQPPPVKLTGKQTEVLEIITNELLDIPGLEQKLAQVLTPYFKAAENAFEHEMAGLSTQQQQALLAEFQTTFSQRFSLSQDATRELTIFLITGLIGKTVSPQIIFGSSFSLGQALALNLYMSQLPWYKAWWVSLSGTPAWVQGAGVGLGAAWILFAVPLISPLIESGLNKARGKKFLASCLSSLETQLLEKSPLVQTSEQSKKEAGPWVSQVALQVQLLPDAIAIMQRLISQIKP